MMAFVDERVRRLSLASAGAAGTVQGVATDRMSATVVVDGSTLGVPVKVAGHTSPVAGDRVALLRIGPRRQSSESYGGEEWCIVGVTSRPAAAPNYGYLNYPMTTGTTVTATVVNLPGNPSFTFTKRSDSTPVAMFGSMSARSNATDSNAALHLGFTDQFGVQVIYRIADIRIEVATTRAFPHGWRVIPDPVNTATMLAGPYTVNLMWARSVGASTISCTTGSDHASAFVMEMGL